MEIGNIAHNYSGRQKVELFQHKADFQNTDIINSLRAE